LHYCTNLPIRAEIRLFLEPSANKLNKLGVTVGKV
jgi:hypothetical protein